MWLQENVKGNFRLKFEIFLFPVQTAFHSVYQKQTGVGCPLSTVAGRRVMTSQCLFSQQCYH